MFVIEAGINHFGETKLAKKTLDFFVKSTFKNLTFMLHTEKFYKKCLKKKINYKLSREFYKKAVNISHEKGKKIGLSVCDLKTFDELKDLNFDFYKLLSIGVNNHSLIEVLRKRNKHVFISTGFNTSISQVKKSIKMFKSKKKLTLLHTPMTYNTSELNFPKINIMRKKFKLDVGYSNHNNDINNLNVLSCYNPKIIFLYCKPLRQKKRIYPDNEHAVYLDELEKVKKNYINYLKANKFTKKIYKIKIFKNGI